MAVNLFEYKGQLYPTFQKEGNASQFAIPYAKHFCSGVGYDIGYGKREWMFPGAIGIDIQDVYSEGESALALPDTFVDYIYSSHCLEHLDNWIEALDYWWEHIDSGGVIFLYLPDYSQFYWRPWNNKKHKHILTVEMLTDYFLDKGSVKVCRSQVDMNNSFMIVAEKP